MENREALLGAINEIPAIDFHTHLDSSHLSARGLHDILLYHMMISELYSAGCPSGTRLSDDPGEEERISRIEEAIPYLKYTENTSIYWIMRRILSDLYAWDDPVTLRNWRLLDNRIREKNSDEQWARHIFQQANIRKASTELALKRDGGNSDILFYSLEWAFFMRNQWKWLDAPLYELEYAWQFDEPVRPLPLLWDRPPAVRRRIKTVADIKEAMDHYCRVIPFDQVTSTANYLSSEINYKKVTDSQMQQAIDNRDNVGLEERDVYASYLFAAYLGKLEKAHKKIAFQFSVGAEPLPNETCSRLRQETIKQVADIIAEHPNLQFQAFLANRHTNQSFCTLCRELPNLTLVGYWWHNFFPGIIAQIIDERLDMVPINKQIAFFSDAYCAEWAYGKSKAVRYELAKALAKRIDRGQYTFDKALDIAKRLLMDTPALFCR